MPRRNTPYDIVSAPMQSGNVPLPFAQISVVVPEGTTNLLTNPSFERDTTGWSAPNATIARTIVEQSRGAWGLSVTPNFAGAGVLYIVSLTSGTSYTFSIDIKARPNTRMQIYFADATTASIGTINKFRASGRWQRVSVTWKETASLSRRLIVATDAGATNDPFYVDGAQLEAKAYPTTYCDGDLVGATRLTPPAYRWQGVPHASPSIRSAATAHGGRTVALTDIGVEVVGIAGIGIPTASNVVTPYVFDGSNYQQTMYHERVLTLSLSIQGKGITETERITHALSRLFNRDALMGQPARCFFQLLNQALLNTINAREVTPLLEFQAVYISGLEQVLSTPHGAMVTLKLTLIDPMMTSVYSKAAGPFTITNSAGAALFQSPGPGIYNQLTAITGGSAIIYAMAYNKVDGKLYVGGNFTAPGSNIFSVDLKDGTVAALGAGTNGDVYTIMFDETGRVGIGGLFVTAGGVVCNNLAYWDGAWHAMGTGTNGRVRSMVIGPQNNILVGGFFTTFNGIVSTHVGAMTAFGTNMGVPILNVNAEVWAIAFGTDTFFFGGSEQVSVYFGGDFTQFGASAVNRICKTFYRPVARTIDNPDVTASGSALNFTGATDTVRALVFDNAGLLYILGKFVFLCSVSCGGVGVWNGGAVSQVWSSLVLYNWPTATIPNPAVAGCVTIDNTVWFCGTFLYIMNPDAYTWVSSGGVAKIVGNQIQLPEIVFGNTYAVAADPYGNTYMGSTIGRIIGDQVTVTNTGTANTYPLMRIPNTGSFPGGLFVVNTTTRKVFAIDNIFGNQRADIINGDIFINFDPNNFICMTAYGLDLRPYILPQSNISEMYLAPGTNVITVNRPLNGGLTDSVTPYMFWYPRYLTVEGAVI